MTFAQWQNCLTTHFSECIPVVKWCISRIIEDKGKVCLTTFHENTVGSRRILFTSCARRRWVVIATPNHFTPRTDTVRIVQEAGWASGLVRTEVENLVPTRVWTLDHLALNEPLYCLCYPDCLIDDRLKYNILSLTVLLWNMTPSREFWRST